MRLTHLPRRWWLLGVLIVLFMVALLAAKLIPSGHQSAQAHKPSAATATTFVLGPWVDFRLFGMDTPQPPDGHFPFNSTTCSWNDQDQLGRSGSGDLGPGVELTDTLCLVADLDASSDPYPKLVGFRVYTPQANLHVWLTDDVGDTWESDPPITFSAPGGKRLVYTRCVQDPVADAANIFDWRDLAYWPLVPGTTGYGQIVNYTLHVTASKLTHKIDAYFETFPNGHSVLSNIQAMQPGPISCPPNDGL